MVVKQPKIIYPTSFETVDIDRQEEQEHGIDEAVKKGYMPVFIFNDDNSNTENFIPTKFKENIENHPMYFVWVDMLMSCYDSNHPNYEKEEEKRVKIRKTWIASFEIFVKDVGFSSKMI